MNHKALILKFKLLDAAAFGFEHFHRSYINPIDKKWQNGLREDHYREMDDG